MAVFAEKLGDSDAESNPPTAACARAAFGLPKPVSFIEAALAETGPEAGKGFRPFEFGKVQDSQSVVVFGQ